MVTSIEAKNEGYESKEPIPEPKRCKYCGATMHHRGLIMPIYPKKIFKWLEPDRCTCLKSQAFWKKYDEEQDKLKRQKEEAEERERLQQKISRLLGNSGIKKRFQSRTFESFEIDNKNMEAYEIANTYAEKFKHYKDKGEGLYFVGSFGTGKTHLAVAIALQLINQGVPVICKTLIDLLGEIKKTFDDDSRVNEHQVLGLYRTVDLLVIDDLGKEPPTDWAMATFYSIINDRYENCLPTIITTNYNDKELIDRLSRKSDIKTAGAIVDRLHEVCFPVMMNWDSRRTGD